jgi:hypothetical protein
MKIKMDDSFLKASEKFTLFELMLVYAYKQSIYKNTLSKLYVEKPYVSSRAAESPSKILITNVSLKLLIYSYL